MKKYLLSIILTLIPLTLCAWGVGMSGVSLLSGSAAPSGPDTWYYAGGSDNYTTSGSLNLYDQGFIAPISVTSGSLTKVSVKLAATTGDVFNARIGIYTGTSSSLTLQQCASFQIPASTAAGWYDYTLTTPINVSTGTVYLSLFGAGSDYSVYYNTSGGYWIYDTYTNACQSSESSDGDDYLPAVRCYVD